MMTKPKFGKHQHVSFIGGVGTILGCRIDSGTWAYAVEMEKGPEPPMGRIGAETTLLLLEADIQEALD